jgi:hypothetical protein
MTTKSVELMQLETALSDLTKHITGLERKVYKEEEEYVRTSIARGSDTSAPQFGNLISGWEGILEGTRVDTNKGREKIYSRACGVIRSARSAMRCVFLHGLTPPPTFIKYSTPTPHSTPTP